MPYVNKELKAEFQKRTATPYVKEWREKNREKHREYMREWAKKRRANPEKKAQDKEKAILSGANQRQKEYLKKRQEVWVENLSDIYIVGLLSRKGSLTRELAKENTQIIDLHKQILLTKRQLKKL